MPKESNCLGLPNVCVCVWGSIGSWVRLGYAMSLALNSLTSQDHGNDIHILQFILVLFEGEMWDVQSDSTYVYWYSRCIKGIWDPQF